MTNLQTLSLCACFAASALALVLFEHFCCAALPLYPHRFILFLIFQAVSMILIDLQCTGGWYDLKHDS